MTSQDFDPANAIETLNSGDDAVEPLMYIVGKMRDDWNPDHTDGRTPHIEFMEERKATTFRDEDYIFLYTVSDTWEPVSIGYDFQNRTTRFSLDIWTSGDRLHMMRLKEEARRVLNNLRKDVYGSDGSGLQGRNWMKFGVSSTPYEKISKGHYHQVVDCEILWRYRDIAV